MRRASSWSGLGERSVQIVAWVLALTAVGPHVDAATLSSFNPDSVFSGTSPAAQAQLDAAVGVTGYLIDDFEHADLIPPLAIEEGGNPASSTIGPPNVDDSYPGGVWDGVRAFVGNVNCSLGDTVFHFQPGVASLGLGIGDVESDVELLIDGVSFGLVRSLPNFKQTGNSPNQPRQVYIRVDADPGDPPISEVRLTQIGGCGGDAIFYDHLAISAEAVPVTSTRGLFLLALLLLATLTMFVVLRSRPRGAALPRP